MCFEVKSVLCNTPLVYQFSPDDVARCKGFSYNNGYGVSEYCRRGCVLEEKVRHDIYSGKLAELVACNTLKLVGLNVTDPDFEIYPVEQKSFDPDLRVKADNKGIHVKSCDLSNSFTRSLGTASWIFNQRDSYGAGGLDFHCLGEASATSDELVCFVVVNTEAGWGSVSFLVAVKSLHEHKLYARPVMESKKLTKVAVYASHGNSSVFSQPVNTLMGEFPKRLDSYVLNYLCGQGDCG